MPVQKLIKNTVKKPVKKPVKKKVKKPVKKKLIKKKNPIKKKKKYGGSNFNELLDQLKDAAHPTAGILTFEYKGIKYVFIGEQHDVKPPQIKSFISVISTNFNKEKSLILLEGESRYDIEYKKTSTFKDYYKDRKGSEIDNTIFYLATKIEKKKKSLLNLFKNKEGNFKSDSKIYVNQEIEFIDDRSRIEQFSQLHKTGVLGNIPIHSNSKYFANKGQAFTISKMKKNEIQFILNALNYELKEIKNLKINLPKTFTKIKTNICSHIKKLNNSKKEHETIEKTGQIFLDVNVILNFINKQEFTQKYVFGIFGRNHIKNINDYINSEITTEMWPK